MAVGSSWVSHHSCRANCKILVGERLISTLLRHKSIEKNCRNFFSISMMPLMHALPSSFTSRHCDRAVGPLLRRMLQHSGPFLGTVPETVFGARVGASRSFSIAVLGDAVVFFASHSSDRRPGTSELSPRRKRQGCFPIRTSISTGKTPRSRQFHHHPRCVEIPIVALVSADAVSVGGNREAVDVDGVAQ